MDAVRVADGEVTLRDRPDADLATPSESKNDEGNGNDKRFTLRLSPEAVATLDWISQSRGGISYQEVIRRALGTEKFLLSLIEDGASIIVEKSGSRPKEIVFR
jgi:predicted DNA binding CopG/RHH family protein